MLFKPVGLWYLKKTVIYLQHSSLFSICFSLIAVSTSFDSYSRALPEHLAHIRLSMNVYLVNES